MNRLNPDKRCIFRQVFNSQDDIDNNPYNPGKSTLSGAVKFKDGYMNPVSGLVVLNPNFKFTFNTQTGWITMRYVFKTTDIVNGGFSTANNCNCVVYQTLGSNYRKLVTGRLWYYVINGVNNYNGSAFSTTALQPNTEYDIIVLNNYLDMGIKNDTLNYISCVTNLKLFEIYNTPFYTPDVKNLYEYKILVPFNDNSEIFHLNAYKGVLNDKFNTPLIYSATLPTIEKNNGYCITLGKTTTQYLTIPFYRDSNSTYTFSFWVKDYGIAWTVLLYDSPLTGDPKFFVVKGGTGSYYGVALDYVATQISSSTIRWSKWNHIAISINKLFITNYVNGGNKTSGSSVDPRIQTMLGISAFGRTISLKNLRIFKRILNDNEINQIYTSEKKLFNL